jgi:CheY-like chemotaxis protein
MDGVTEHVTILMADDDPEDCMMTGKALEATRGVSDLRFVGDDEGLIDCLMRRDKYADPLASPRPGIILLDLNMPKKDGHAALVEIKTHPEIRGIPIVVLTTSDVEEDIEFSYDRGASSFITKPNTYPGLVKAMKCDVPLGDEKRSAISRGTEIENPPRVARYHPGLDIRRLGPEFASPTSRSGPRRRNPRAAGGHS